MRLVLSETFDHIHQTSLSLMRCAGDSKLITSIDLVSIGFCDDENAFVCAWCNDITVLLGSGNGFCSDKTFAFCGQGVNWSWLLVPLLLAFTDCGAFGALKLFCDWILRDFSKGGFLIDDENAKPRRNVALNKAKILKRINELPHHGTYAAARYRLKIHIITSKKIYQKAITSLAMAVDTKCPYDLVTTNWNGPKRHQRPAPIMYYSICVLNLNLNSANFVPNEWAVERATYCCLWIWSDYYVVLFSLSLSYMDRARWFALIASPRQTTTNWPFHSPRKYFSNRSVRRSRCDV